MDRSLLQRYTGRDDAAPDDADAVEDLGCFGWLRGARERSPMLELRKKNGNRLAVGYTWIERLELDPSEGILVVVGSLRIQIRGRNLNTPGTSGLFESVTRQRVPWVREVSELGFVELSEEACLIEEIV